MRKLMLPVIGFLMISCHSFSQCRIDIEVSGLRNSTGSIMLQLMDENEKIIDQQICSIKEKACSLSIPGIRPGRYAIRYYHDENMNGKMETNLVGKPTEGYGFSNNVTGKFGAPPFEKWLFELKEDKKIGLNITY